MALRGLVCACPTTAAVMGARPTEDVSSDWEQASRAKRAGARSGSHVRQAGLLAFVLENLGEQGGQGAQGYPWLFGS